jgi:hypothetical protein
MSLPTLFRIAVLSLIAVLPLAAQSSDAPSLPAGWIARPDGGGDSNAIKFVIMEPGYHLTLGPATILYRTADRVDGPFHTLATFHQMKKMEHPEGYGLFIGGQSLDGPAQRYTYFLVRGDGKFIIKRRDGEKLSEHTKGWQSSPAVKKADAKGSATNLLEIDAKVDPKRVSFKVNGKEVHSIPSDRIDTKGIVGIRANHYLDLHVEGFAIHE